MASQSYLENNGIGGTPYLVFTVDTSANKDFTQSDLDNNLTACVISANNEVGMGKAGDKLFGRVVWVSQELQSETTVPTLCAASARGVLRFKYDLYSIPELDDGVCVNGEGRVASSQLAFTVWGAGYRNKVIGQVIAIDEENETCDIWLG